MDKATYCKESAWQPEHSTDHKRLTVSLLYKKTASNNELLTPLYLVTFPIP